MKSGQQYLRARFYDPASGTFNRLDPFAGNLADPQSLHKYLYAHANPVAFSDPSGEGIATWFLRDFSGKLFKGNITNTQVSWIVGFAVGSIVGSLMALDDVQARDAIAPVVASGVQVAFIGIGARSYSRSFIKTAERLAKYSRTVGFWGTAFALGFQIGYDVGYGVTLAVR